ncbi:MAG: alpha/beta hydrolase family protein [Parabacteroides sp.]
MLLVHGDIDKQRPPWHSAMRAVDGLDPANKTFRSLLLLPQQRHGFGDMDEYFYWRMVDYFSEHLLGDSDKSVDIPKR